MVQAAFWFAVMGTLVQLAGERLPTLQIVFARGVVTLAIATASLAMVRRSPLGGRTGLLLLRGVLGSSALVCFYIAVVHLGLPEATVVHQTAPLFTAVIAARWLGERLPARTVLALCGAFAGVVIIARPDWLTGLPATGAATWPFTLVALLGAVLSAFAYVTVRRLGRTEHPLVVVFWFPLVTVPATAPFALPQWLAPTPREWLLLLGIGAATQIAQVSLTKGLAREPAGRATAVGYLQVAFATLAGIVVFGVWPDGWTWLGMAIVVASLAMLGRRSPPAD